MGFDDLSALVNSACLAAFGSSFTYTRISTNVSQSVMGILDAGVQLENVPPGDGSAYARLWFDHTTIDPVPDPGDEIASATTIYKIVRLEEDAGGGLWMLLRQDREV